MSLYTQAHLSPTSMASSKLESLQAKTLSIMNKTKEKTYTLHKSLSAKSLPHNHHKSKKTIWYNSNAIIKKRSHSTDSNESLRRLLSLTHRNKNLRKASNSSSLSKALIKPPRASRQRDSQDTSPDSNEITTRIGNISLQGNHTTGLKASIQNVLLLILLARPIFLLPAEPLPITTHYKLIV